VSTEKKVTPPKSILEGVMRSLCRIADFEAAKLPEGCAKRNEIEEAQRRVEQHLEK